MASIYCWIYRDADQNKYVEKDLEFVEFKKESKLKIVILEEENQDLKRKLEETLLMLEKAKEENKL